MSGSNDLTFLSPDVIFEPMARQMVKAFEGMPAFSNGTQLRLGLQLARGALLALDPQTRAHLSAILAPVMFDTIAEPMPAAPSPRRRPRAPAKIPVPIGYAFDMKQVKGMVMH